MNDFLQEYFLHILIQHSLRKKNNITKVKHFTLIKHYPGLLLMFRKGSILQASISIPVISQNYFILLKHRLFSMSSRGTPKPWHHLSVISAARKKCVSISNDPGTGLSYLIHNAHQITTGSYLSAAKGKPIAWAKLRLNPTAAPY